MIITPGGFQSVLGGVQSLVVSIGLIVGGIWTATVFRVLGQKKRAEAELRAIQRELCEQAVVVLTMDADQLPASHSHPYLLTARVHIRNTGNRNTRLDFGAVGPLSVCEIELGETGEPRPVHESLFGPLDRPGTSTQYSIVSPGETITLVFLASVHRPGLYLVTFSAVVEEDDLSQMETQVGPGYADAHLWSVQEVVLVREFGQQSAGA